MLADLCGYSKVRSVTHDIQIDTVLFFNTIFNNLSKPAMNRFFVFPKRTAAFAGSTYCISLWAMLSTTTGAMKFTIPSRGRPSPQKLGTGIVTWWHWKNQHKSPSNHKGAHRQRNRQLLCRPLLQETPTQILPVTATSIGKLMLNK